MELTHPIKIRERVLHYAALDEPKTFDKGVMGAITGAFNNALIGGDRSMYSAALHRRQVWGILFTKDDCIPGEFHSTALSPTEWNGLFRWMGASWNKNNMRPQFSGEVHWVYMWAEKAFKMLKDNPGLTMAELITIFSNEEEKEQKDG
jgi:hypothetical protein